jgi:hypothetical protein
MRTNTITQQPSIPPDVSQPTTTPGAHRRTQETSHVFYCMQCDLHMQMDIAVLDREGSTEGTEGMIRVRLDPRTRLARETSALEKGVPARSDLAQPS